MHSRRQRRRALVVMKNKRLLFIFLIVAILLLIPIIAMQFTQNVNWALLDFVVAGLLLLGAGLLFELVLRKVKSLRYRIVICLAILILLFLIWAELAVGIF